MNVIRRIMDQCDKDEPHWVAGSGDGAGLLPVSGRPTTLAYGRAGACCACSRCGMDGLFFVCFCFHLVYPIFLF